MKYFSRFTLFIAAYMVLANAAPMNISPRCMGAIKQFGYNFGLTMCGHGMKMAAKHYFNAQNEKQNQAMPLTGKAVASGGKKKNTVMDTSAADTLGFASQPIYADGSSQFIERDTSLGRPSSTVAE